MKNIFAQRLDRTRLRICRCAVAALALAAACAQPALAAARDESPGQWYHDAEAELHQALKSKAVEGPAKNVILFVGDGMGIATVTAARIYDGQKGGGKGEENFLAFEQLPYLALAKTYETNQQVPDAAGTMTAIMTGTKTAAGVLGLDQYVERGNCGSAKGKRIQTLLEQAGKLGKSLGVVTNGRLTGATAAATYAHSPDSRWESDTDIPQDQRKAGCPDIASQLVSFSAGSGLDVAFGGGRSKFLPASSGDGAGVATPSGDRSDGRDLTAAWHKRYPHGSYIWNAKQLDALNPAKAEHVLGLFSPSDMAYAADRAKAPGDQPSLVDMTARAIALLKHNRKGFFLMVADSNINRAHEAGNAWHALDETREFALAVRKALALTSAADTLVIVTADHGDGLTITGYPTRGNPILGKVVANNEAGKPADAPAKALDELPYTTLGYVNGPGALAVHDAKSDQLLRRDLGDVDTTAPDYLQQALVPLAAVSHSGEDVPVYAGGPWAQLFRRTVEQNYIYHVMHYAMTVPPKAKKNARSKRHRQ